MIPPSALDDAALDGLRRDVAADPESRFVDPARLRHAVDVFHRVPQAWVDRVVGRPEAWFSRCTWPEVLLVMAAATADAPHLAALREHGRLTVEAAAAAAADATRAEETEREDAWQVMASRLPVPVFVGHNWTLGHHDGYVTGRDHVVVQAPLSAGRLVRAAGEALCETPSRQRSGHMRALERGPGHAHGEPPRVPTCRACLTIARRLAGGA